MNREIANLENLVRIAPANLQPGGTLAIISFHSGKDRVVKSAFRAGQTKGVYGNIFKNRCERRRARGWKTRGPARRSCVGPMSVRAGSVKRRPAAGDQCWLRLRPSLTLPARIGSWHKPSHQSEPSTSPPAGVTSCPKCGWRNCRRKHPATSIGNCRQHTVAMRRFTRCSLHSEKGGAT